MYYRTVLCAIALYCSACSDPPSISVNCSLTQQDEYAVECGNNNNSNNVNGSPSVEEPSAMGDAGALPGCQPIPMVGPWVRDIDGSASFGSFVLHSTGENWRFALDLPEGTIAKIEVPARPFATPPTKPATSATLVILGGSYLDQAWEVLGEVSDDADAPTYGVGRTIILGGLAIRKEKKDGRAYALTLKAPLDNVETSALVVNGPPYVTLACP